MLLWFARAHTAPTLSLILGLSFPQQTRKTHTTVTPKRSRFSRILTLLFALSVNFLPLSRLECLHTCLLDLSLCLYPSIASITASSRRLQLQPDQKKNEYLGQSHMENEYLGQFHMSWRRNLSLVSLLLQSILPDFHDGFWSLSFWFLLLCWLIHKISQYLLLNHLVSWGK